LLKNTVKWHTPKKIKDLWGFGRVRAKKDFCKEFERESLILAYTKRRKKSLFIFISCFSIVIKEEVLLLSEPMMT